jgi:hypothetical protein
MARNFNVVAGVDTHKKTHTIVVLDSVASEILRFTIQADVRGCEDAIVKVSALGAAVWGIEGAGVYGRQLAEMRAISQTRPRQVRSNRREGHCRSGFA